MVLKEENVWYLVKSGFRIGSTLKLLLDSVLQLLIKSGEILIFHSGLVRENENKKRV